MFGNELGAKRQTLHIPFFPQFHLFETVKEPIDRQAPVDTLSTFAASPDSLETLDVAKIFVFYSLFFFLSLVRFFCGRVKGQTPQSG